MIIPGGFGAPGAVLGGTAIKPMATSCGINDLPGYQRFPSLLIELTNIQVHGYRYRTLWRRI